MKEFLITLRKLKDKLMCKMRFITFSVLNSLKDEVKESDNKLNTLIIPSSGNDQKVIEKEIDDEYEKTLRGLRGSNRFKQIDPLYINSFTDILKTELVQNNFPLVDVI